LYPVLCYGRTFGGVLPAAVLLLWAGAAVSTSVSSPSDSLPEELSWRALRLVARRPAGSMVGADCSLSETKRNTFNIHASGL